MDQHKIRLDQPHQIADLASYLSYWREIAHERDVEAAELADEVDGVHVFSSNLPTDVELRLRLQRARLNEVLRWQEMERKDEESIWECLFCRTNFQGWHGQLVNHMAKQHNFSMGQPYNLVFVKELLDIVGERMEENVCVYCEKTFKNREVLKEHMRKKAHKRLNPHNKTYDKFYVVNYQEFGKDWDELSQEGCRRESDEEEDALNGFTLEDKRREMEELDESWDDWREESQNEELWERTSLPAAPLGHVTCLFCDKTFAEMSDLLLHMSATHAFDFHHLRNAFKMDFYRQVKLVNYIRRQMHLGRCLHCNLKFANRQDLLAHMQKLDHLRPPKDVEEWDRPEFLFPIYEDDGLLCRLEDVFEPLEAPVECDDEDTVGIIKASILKDEEFRNSISSSAKN